MNGVISYTVVVVHYMSIYVSAQQKMEDLSMYLKLLSFLDTSALIVAAAAANDASTVRDFLSKKPHEVA